jgi:hypothetical protein
MFGFKSKAKPVDVHRQFETDLVAIISNARRAGVGAAGIAKILESEAHFLRHCAAVTYAPNRSNIVSK